MSDFNQNANNLLKEKYQKAAEAFRNNEKRRSAILVHEILDQDITHLGAWHLMYYIVGSTKSFEEFQMEFAQKYYPRQAHRLNTNKMPPAQPAPQPVPLAGGNSQLPAHQPTVRQTLMPVLAITPQDPPPATPAPTNSLPMKFAYCPGCGQKRIGEAQFCSNCGSRFEPGVNYQPPAVQPVYQPAPIPATYPTYNYRPNTPKFFTPKRIIATIGLILIMLAGIFPWYTVVDMEWFVQDAFTHMGLTDSSGVASTVFAFIGLALLLAVKGEKSANVAAFVFAVFSGFCALGFIMGSSWGNSASLAYNKLEIGPLTVFLGVAITFVSLLISPQPTEVA